MVVPVNPVKVKLPLTVLALNWSVTSISLQSIGSGLVVPDGTFCTINLISFAVNPDGVVNMSDCINGNSFPNLIIISEAPGSKLWSLPLIVE